MNILHISDIHFRRVYEIHDGGYKAIFNKMTNPVQLLEECAEEALKNSIDLVVVTGDLTENGDAEDYRELRKVMDRIFQGIPYVVTLGNHDVKSAFWKGWFDEEPVNRPYNTVWKSGEVSVISFDSSEEGNPDGKIRREQIEWLKEQTKLFAGKPSLLITHHHFMNEQGVVPPVECPEEFVKILADSGISGVLCGHTHHHFTSRFHGIPYFTADSMSFAGEEDSDGVKFEEKYGYSFYRFEDGMFKFHKIETNSPGKRLGCVVF